MDTTRIAAILAMASLSAALACGGGGSGTDSGPEDATGPQDLADVPADVPADARDEAAPDTALDVPEDVPAEGLLPDAPGDVPDEVQDEGAPYARFVNVFIGSGAESLNIGNTYPSATAPLGLVKAGPDTMVSWPPWGATHCAGYRYEDTRIIGFTHNRLEGTGAGDYSNVQLMPVATFTPAKAVKAGQATTYDKASESAVPGAYGVTLDDPHVRVELGASPRCALHRYEFLDKPGEGTLVLDAASALMNGYSKGGQVTIDPATGATEGWNHNHGEFSGRYNGFKLWYALEFDRAPKGFGTWADGTLHDGQAGLTGGEKSEFGAWYTFDTATNPVVQVKVCLSYTSVQGAKAAMAAELPTFDLEAVRAATLAAWEGEMARIEVTGGSFDDKVNFYTALYHSLQMPTLWSDVDGQYQGFDKAAHPADGWSYYTDFSLWDTFRTALPLATLLWPDRQRDFLRSLAAMIAQGGYAPKWAMGAGDTGSMIGQHSIPWVADAYLKGVKDFDVEAVYKGLRQTATEHLPAGSYGGRSCLDSWLDQGYCAQEDAGGSVSITLEFAYNDFCMARLAEALGKTEDVPLFDARGRNWKNVWDPEATDDALLGELPAADAAVAKGFFRAKKRDGSWYSPFNAQGWGDDPYTEASAWQYLWFVPQDEAGLRQTLGGDTLFVKRLQLFLQNLKDYFDFLAPSQWYFHGNEPDLHSPYLFINAGRPELTQEWVAWIRQVSYRNSPQGLIGNDDAGTLAAWLVFSGIGLYPSPCLPGYYVTSPMFDRITVHLPGGKDLKITADGAGNGKFRIKTATWNGAPLTGYWLTHDQVAAGGELVLEMM